MRFPRSRRCRTCGLRTFSCERTINPRMTRACVESARARARSPGRRDKIDMAILSCHLSLIARPPLRRPHAISTSVTARTNGSATNHSRRKPINPVGRISRRAPRAPSRSARDAHIRARRPEGALSGPRREEREYRRNSRTKRKEVGRGERDAWYGCGCGCRAGEWGERGGGGSSGRTRSGEGDATRLINRHADNHSGFMVTTDYQVVQGGIFHIRDVTLFQWGEGRGGEERYLFRALQTA